MAAAGDFPVGGVDYPRNLQEFDAWFSSEDACVEYLESLRWGHGFRCPACGGEKGWATARNTVRCAACQRQTSVTADTIFHRTWAPLRMWFQAAWWITTQKPGMSALGLQRVLGLGSYRTAWTWLHKLRRAMVRPGRDLLAGEVEVDETYVGGVEPGILGRQPGKKAIVVIAAEMRGNGIGRIRMGQVPDATGANLCGFVKTAVTRGTVVHTDGWSGYSRLTSLGLEHKPKSIAASGDPAHVVMPRVHRVAALLDRWILGTYQGSVTTKHLDYYLDEFTFRFNRRTSRDRGLLFYRLLEQAVEVDPAPYHTLVGGGPMPRYSTDES